MKFFIPALVVVAALSGIVGYFSQPSGSQLNALGVANLEALTYDEWGFDHGCDGPGDGCILPSFEWHPDLRGVDY